MKDSTNTAAATLAVLSLAGVAWLLVRLILG